MFEIDFCPHTPKPIVIVYNRETLTFVENEVIVLAASIHNVLDNLKGTEAKTISNINRIRRC